jgi:class 3 adenylate cyclase/tetratricopeptide (TPR) repeat protein
MVCASCGAENNVGRRFCVACGSPLPRTCGSCNAPAGPDDAFCGECGAPLEAAGPGVAPASPAPAAPARPDVERRLVSVLFADLVGFTALSESRDAEEVREILTGYFDRCARLISRYGGTVEKFIGDAVMAVWGAPIAQEDDAERAVRAALDILAAVEALGQDIGAPQLRARAGVLTGEAAVTLGAAGQGMVAGDLVNTASRVQARAEPGTVLVGDATRRATEVAIAYADAGTHALKGKAEEMPLWRAVHVTAGRAGARKSSGLEPPFVGRKRELRLVKELFHASAEERHAHHVSVVGVAGIGKSRLAWEFFKYVDGLVEEAWWHHGRSLAYGEGNTYWALAEMVRNRAGITDEDELTVAQEKLRRAIEVHVGDPDEREWIAPRLAHLLGLGDRTTGEREDLFAAWRVFFERMAESGPVVMVFEDVQWGDVSLLEFVEYLLEWSRDRPIYVLTLARPDLFDNVRGWGGGTRNFTSLALEPLPPDVMQELLGGMVPGLSRELRDRVLERAGGVPLYAVETVRMLLDRGLLERVGEEYRPVGPITTLEVPETLHALLAARLDGLSGPERRVVQDASVLGKTFSEDALVAIAGDDVDVAEALTSLVRKEVLARRGDPRPPERGHYGFLQDLLRHVAYETLTKRERKARHLLSAQYLVEALGPSEEEVVEAIAAHYVAAYEAVPEDADAAAIKERARATLVRAGERAASLAASDAARRYFDQAAALADSGVEQAHLLELAGQMAWTGGAGEAATERFERAIALFERAEETHAAARVSARLGEMTWAAGRLDEGVERMERSFAVLADDPPDADLAALAAQLGRLHYFTGDFERAAARIEQALAMAEGLAHPEVLSQTLNTKGILCVATGRTEEGFALVRHALKLGLDAGIQSAALRAYFNLASLLLDHDRFEPSLDLSREGLTLARRIGDRGWEWSLVANIVLARMMRGEWDEALAQVGEIPHFDALESSHEFTGVRFAAVELLLTVAPICVARGQVEEAAQVLGRYATFRDSADVQERIAYGTAASAILRARGKPAEALRLALAAFDDRAGVGNVSHYTKMSFLEAVEAALDLGELDQADRLLEAAALFSPTDLTPLLRAQVNRFGARLCALRGDAEGAEERFAEAVAGLRRLEVPFWLALAQLELGEWLADEGRAAEAAPALAEAAEAFRRLDARPWRTRADLAAQAAQAAAERSSAEAPA